MAYRESINWRHTLETGTAATKHTEQLMLYVFH